MYKGVSAALPAHAPSQVDNLVDTYREIVSMYKGASAAKVCRHTSHTHENI